jgi:uncharacterized protein (DUF1697 family)
MNKYLALLRGINVGGNNIIKMVDLKACFEKMGFLDVSTYIQSGNVLFSSPETSLTKLTERIEKTLSKQFSYQSTVVVVSHQELKDAVKKAPKGFGTQPTKYRYDVIFLKAPLTGKEAIKEIKLREGVDEAAFGKNVLYFRRTEENITKSYVSKIVALPMYKSMTIRNWNSTSKLLALMSSEDST